MPSPFQRHVTARRWRPLPGDPPSSPTRSGGVGWQPKYLGRFPIIAFVATFALSGIALEALLAASELNNGLAASVPERSCLWKYGPTVLLTILSAAWNRVAFQAQKLEPWSNMLSGPAEAEQSLVLDYVSANQFVVLFAALRRRRWDVAGSTAVVVLIKVLIVMSTGLIVLAPVNITRDPFPVTLESSFVDDPSRLWDSGDLLYMTMAGLATGELPYPDGTTPEFAYQQVDASAIPDGALLNTSVEALSAGLDCEPASLRLEMGKPITPLTSSATVLLRAPGCDFEMATEFRTMDDGSYVYTRADVGSCNGTKEGDPDAVRLFAFIGAYSDGARSFRSAQLVCRPTYNISRAHILRNRTDPVQARLRQADEPGHVPPQPLPPPPPPPRGLENAHAADLMQAFLDSHVRGAAMSVTQEYGDGISVQPDIVTYMMLAGAGVPANTSISHLIDRTFLQDTLTRYYRRFVAQLAHAALVDRSRVPSSGKLTAVSDRLLVRALVCHPMSSLLFVSALLGIVLYRASAAPRTPPRDPGTVIGISLLMGSSPGVTSMLRRLGPASEKELVACVDAQLWRAVSRRHGVPDNTGEVGAARSPFRVVGKPRHAAGEGGTEMGPLSRGGRLDEGIDRQETDCSGRSDSFRRRHRDDGSDRDSDRAPGEELPGSHTTKNAAAACRPPRGGSLAADDTPKRTGTEKPCPPFVLRPVVGIVMAAVGLATVASLEITLRTSRRDSGLGDAPAVGYLDNLWTTMPAVYLGYLALFYSMVDSETRTLAPFAGLLSGKGGPSSSRWLALDLLDAAAPRIFRAEIRTQSWPALLSTLSMLAASVLIIISGSLFASVSVPVRFRSHLSTETSFTWNEFAANDAGRDFGFGAFGLGPILSSLVLRMNLTFPEYTYETLAYPAFAFPDDNGNRVASGGAAPVATVAATLPALRSNMACRLYGRDQIRANLTLNYTLTSMVFSGSSGLTVSNPLRIDVDGEECRKPIGMGRPTELTESNFALDTTSGIWKVSLAPDPSVDFTPAEARFFIQSQDDLALNPTAGNWNELKCSQYLYAWGRFRVSPATGERDVYVSAMGCNETIEAVDVETRFLVGGDDGFFRIDPGRPPIPDDRTARLSSVTYRLDGPGGHLYDGLVNVTSRTSLVDAFGTLLTTSRYGIPPEYLSDESKADRVAEAIKFQHGIVRAQFVSDNWRTAANSTAAGVPIPDCNATLPNRFASEEQKDDAVAYPAMVTFADANRRVVQDAASTRTLQALLCVIVALSLAGMGPTPSRHRFLPRGPTSIASATALVAGGNLFDVLPPDGIELVDDRELLSRLDAGNWIFSLGWITKGQGGDSERSFGIWAQKRDQGSAGGSGRG